MSKRPVMLVLAALVGAGVTLFLTGLDSGGVVATGGGSRGDGADVLASVAGEDITRAEVEAAAGAQFAQLRQQMFDLTEQGLGQEIDRRLLEKKAAERGQEIQAMVSEILDEAPVSPTDAQIDSVYEEFRDRLNAPRDSVVGQIRAFLVEEGRRARFDRLLASLRDEYDVVNRLEPPRLEVAATGPAKGPEGAPVTIVEFSDFECPFCLRIHPTLQRVMSEYEGDVRLVFRQFPLTGIHPRAQKAAEASLCAREQGKFWEMHDALFADPSNLGVPSLKRRAADLGLDTAAFDRCLDSAEKAAEVAADLEAGRKLGVSGTPALYINGRPLSGAQPYEVISRVIDDELRRAGA